MPYISPIGLKPKQTFRLVSALEAFSNGLGDGIHTVAIVGFGSILFSPVRDLFRRKYNLHRGRRKISNKQKKNSATDERAEEWKQSFIRAPYLRDELIKNGLVIETFETAITWSHFNATQKDMVYTSFNGWA